MAIFPTGSFPMDDVITLALAAAENVCEYTSPVLVHVIAAAEKENRDLFLVVYRIDG